MTEDFVPFELAKKLTLKGFNAPCIAYYDEGFLRYNTKYPFVLTAEELLISHNSEYTWVDAPTIPQALKWLREEKKIFVCVDISKRGWFYVVSPIITEDCKEISREYEVDDKDFSDYNSAAIAGIEYVIDNLI